MRIDPKSMISGFSALVVRKTLRNLRILDHWNVTDLEKAAALALGTGGDLVKPLQAEGLIEPCAGGAWCVTQLGRRFSVASAAKPVTRATAERALKEFLGRVGQVNRDPYFLGKVVRVVLFGSMLKPEVDRLSDVDVAVELATKETDFDRAREQNYARAEKLEGQGQRFQNFLDRELCWYFETRHFLKGAAGSSQWLIIRPRRHSYSRFRIVYCWVRPNPSQTPRDRNLSRWFAADPHGTVRFDAHEFDNYPARGSLI
jgi:predicted nucleotidyltransferase